MEERFVIICCPEDDPAKRKLVNEGQIMSREETEETIAILREAYTSQGCIYVALRLEEDNTL